MVKFVTLSTCFITHVVLSSGHMSTRLFYEMILNNCLLVRRISPQVQQSFSSLSDQDHTYAKRMTGKCDQLLMEPVHTCPGAAAVRIEKGPMYLWVRFRCKFSLKFGPEFRLNWCTETPDPMLGTAAADMKTWL